MPDPHARSARSIDRTQARSSGLAPLARLLLAGFVLMAMRAPAASASAPPDFDLVAAGGSRSPGSDYAWIHIDAVGHAEFAVHRADSLTAAPLDTVAFVLTSGQLDSLWQKIEDEGFFALVAGYQDPSGADGSIVRIRVAGNSASWTVTAVNFDVAALDSIVAAINAITPGTHDLNCSYTPPEAYSPQDGCGNTAPDLSAGPPLPADTPSGAKPGAPQLPWLQRAALERRSAKVVGQARLVGTRPARPDAANVVDAPHPATTIAYHMSIYDALTLGIATITSKGGYYGDEASLTVDNTSGVTTNDLETDLYLDLYGPGASAQNADQVAGVIEAAWSGFQTSGGVTMGVEVHNQVWPGATAPPGTAGYHQILLGDRNTQPPVGRPFVSPLGIVNQGSTGGHWNDLPPIALILPNYAHETGHLMGLPDRYVEYEKQSDSTWTSQGQPTLMTSQLAKRLIPRFAGWTLQQINDFLNKPDVIWSTFPKPGFESDIMATNDGVPRQVDIDSLALQAGLVVDVPAGTVLANKDPASQNLLTLRESHMFVPKGQVRTILGLWTACIDLERHIPTEGVGFDVVPPLSQWTGSTSAAAAAMQQIVSHVNAQRLFCDWEAQFAIWQLTDGTGNMSGADSAFFAAAGVALPLPTGFPHFTDPAAGTEGTQLVVPHEFFVPSLTLGSPDVVPLGQSLPLTASVLMSPPAGTSLSLDWSVNGPSGSAAGPSPISGPNSALRPDLPGTYRLHLTSHVTTPIDTFSIDRTRDVMCANAFTETFESGIVESGEPFHWVTAGESSWVAYTGFQHTGAYSAVSPVTASAASSSMSTMLTLSSPGALSFAYRISAIDPGSALRVLLDGNVAATYQNTLAWSLASVALPAGTHSITWNLLQGAPGNPNGPDFASIDDIVFPPGTQLTGVGSEPPLPAVASLGPCRPNPVVTGASIPFALPRAGPVRIALYDLQGREVARLADGEYSAGEHQVRLDATRLPPGLYSVRFRSGHTDLVHRLVLLH